MSFLGSALVVAAGLAAASGAVGCALAMLRMRRGSGLGGRGRRTVIAQYEAPPGLPPLIAGPILRAKRRRASSQIVHLAVNGAIRIEEGHRAESGGSGAPALRLLDRGRAADELDVLAVDRLFSGSASGGVRLVPKKDHALAQTMRTLVLAGDREAVDRGYLISARDPAGRLFGGIALVLLALFVLLFILNLTEREDPVAGVVAFIAAVVALWLAFSAMARRRLHTERGAEALAHLRGLREFIVIAEQQRIAVLQSHSGAERQATQATPTAPAGGVTIVRLYERLLPYAMLFGLEREWSRVLETRYQEEGISPIWVSGVATAFATGFVVGQFDSLDQSLGDVSDSADAAASDGGGWGGWGGGDGGGDGGGGDGGA